MNTDYIIKYLKENYILIGVLLSSLYILRKPDKYNLITFFIVVVFGYLIHLAGHLIRMKKLAKKIMKPLKKYIRRKEYKKSIKNKINYLADLFEFHHNTHHDDKESNTPINQLYEFILNILTQGLIPLFAMYILREFLNLINLELFVLWGLVYATVHLINFKFIKSASHEEHHKNYIKNIQDDFLLVDTLFDSKYDDYLENVNHYSVNIILTTCLLKYLHNI